MRTNIIVDHTETIAGCGIIKKDIITPGSKHFTVYGFLHGELGKYVDQAINSLSDIAEISTKAIVQKNTEGNYANFFGTLAAYVTKEGLCALKKCLENREIDMACQYIIKLVSYCRKDLPMNSIFTVDAIVEGLLGALPIPRQKSRNIYAYSSPQSLRDLPSKVKWDNEGAQNIGYLLYSLFRSQSVDYRTSNRVLSAYEALSIYEGDVHNYENHFVEDMCDRDNQIQCLKEVFRNANYEKLKMDPKYLHNVVKKMEEHYPTNGNKIVKFSMKSLNDILEENTSGEKIVLNIFSQALKLLQDGCQIGIENAKEIFLNYIRNSFGSDVANNGEAICKGADDYDNIIKS